MQNLTSFSSLPAVPGARHLPRITWDAPCLSLFVSGGGASLRLLIALDDLLDNVQYQLSIIASQPVLSLNLIAMSTSVLISTFSPFPTLALSVPSESTFADLYELLAVRYPTLPLDSDATDLVLTPTSGPVPALHSSISALLDDADDATNSLVTLRLVPRLRGGKGGFGSQLRAAGGRMSSQKTSNNDSCRDLSGRRLSTIKEAKKCVSHCSSFFPRDLPA